ncbi:helix-turn-helix domain-containing protein [Enterococcus rotai]
MLYVTRQSISNWENGKSTPNSDILKQLSNIQMSYKN